MKALFTILALSLCLGAMGQDLTNPDSVKVKGIKLSDTAFFRFISDFQTKAPDTTRIGGRMIVTYPKGYYEKDTMPVWFMVSGSDCCPKHVADSGVHGKMVVVIAGFKVIEREVFRREWDAGNPYPSTVYSINTNPLQWYQYLREDKRPIEGLIIWDTKSR